ncbi:hypothetical protein [Pleomorphovibrio marinus]|uniref:hypothetical protein n=1 Tax=Pleomorphovibrio marinus TaxID=2164132 RepID=UPI001E5BC0AD|nr:hypothetical protein [Pleomorphovibrio marinus]
MSKIFILSLVSVICVMGCKENSTTSGSEQKSEKAQEAQRYAEELGLEYVEPNVETIITYEEVNAAQQAWCDALVEIGRLYDTDGDYREYTEKVLKDAYNFENGKVFFKPTLAHGPQTFRTTKEGAMAYFIGGNDKYADDSGFALKPWVEARYENVGSDDYGIQIYGSTAITMGNVWVTDKEGNTVMVDKTFVFKKTEDDKIRIIVHKSALPFEPNL